MSTLESFKSVFKGDIIEPSSPGYLEAIARWSKNSERKARYVLFPKDNQDVSEAIKFARTSKLPLAVKGGGHNPSGASSVEDGVSIDLNRHLDTARIDPDKKLAYVGGGALWKTVDHAAIKHGLATPGGTINHTGVGGLILGGGFGYLSGKHGLTIDNVVQATVVLADGSIVTANETSHPDLYWAIRGGGGNFGIVTEFVLKLHPQRKTVFGGFVIFPPHVLEQVVAVVDNWWKEAHENEMMMFGFTRGQDQRCGIMAVLFYNGSEEEARQRFKPLLDIGPVVDMAKEIPYEELNEVLNHGNQHGRRNYMTETSLKSNIAPHAESVFEALQSLDKQRHVFINYELTPNRNICKIPHDATAYRNRGPQPNVLIMVSWDEEETNDVDHARAFSKHITALINASAEKELKAEGNQGYSNYNSDPVAAATGAPHLWGDNYPRLQKVKYKYDPDCVFNRWFPIQPRE